MDAVPLDHLLYSQPLSKLLVLHAQISDLFFIFDLFEQFGKSIYSFC